MKPLSSLVAQTWNQLRRFPSSDALADAVLIEAVLHLVRAPFALAKFPGLPDKWRRWNLLIRPLLALGHALSVLWSLDLATRLRRDEKTARRIVIAGAALRALFCANGLFFAFLLRNGLRELTEEDQQGMTEEEIARYNAALEKAREEPWKPFLTPRQIVSVVISLAVALNVLRCALSKKTRKRFS
jgi:hypothetical protein